MKELFVNYEIAMKLKEHRFDVPCFCSYRNSDGEEMLIPTGMAPSPPCKNSDEFIMSNPDNCAAPMYQQVVDWLRETHGVHICIFTNEANGFWFDFEYFKQNKTETICYNKDYYVGLAKAIDTALNEIPV